MKLLLLAAISLVIFSSCSTSKLGSHGRKEIEGKTYVIIGASSGFGRGVAEELGRCKANVVVAARRTELLNEIADKIRSSGGQALVVTMDISNPQQVTDLRAAAVKEFGHVDVWINDVGVGAIGRFWEIPIEDQTRIIDVNLKGFVYGSYEAINLFRAQHYGVLINLGSIDSETPLAYQGTYAATKAAVRSLGQSLNQELRLNDYHKIKVVTIEPWAVDTPWWGHAANYSGGTPRMAAMDGPEKVVNAIMRKSIRPRKELPVGWKARASYISHHIFPHFTERFSANVAHKYQIENAPPAPPTKGSIYEPTTTGTGIDDGVRRRMKEEKKMKRNKSDSNQK
jgi:short-subunit dehydrogenase